MENIYVFLVYKMRIQYMIMYVENDEKKNIQYLEGLKDYIKCILYLLIIYVLNKGCYKVGIQEIMFICIK